MVMRTVSLATVPAHLPSFVDEAEAAHEHVVTTRNGPPVGKPLWDELDGLRSARRGNYRVVFAVDEGVAIVVVMRIVHRRNGCWQ